MTQERQNILLYQLALHALGVDIDCAEKLFDVFDDIESFFTLDAGTLTRLAGFESPLFKTDKRREAFEKAQREMEFINKHSIRTLWFNDPSYPPLLRLCPDAPILLFALGDVSMDLETHMLSIVGTRHATAYGTSFTSTLVRSLADTLTTKPVIVSGLAYGIDVAAHRAALENHLPTIAVTAHGLNTIYPAVHRRDAARIVAEGGMILTEYFTQDRMYKGSFLQRNRIIAGLSQATVVVESDARGGALATARLAEAYSREIFAVPGRNSDRYSSGCNQLIQRGRAQILLDAAGLTQSLNWSVKKPTEASQPTLFPELSPKEKIVIDLITHQGDASLEEIKRATAETVSGVLNILGEMEFNNLVAQMPSGRYRIK